MITYEATQAPIPVPPILPIEPDQFPATPNEQPPHEPTNDPTRPSAPNDPEPKLPRVGE